MRGHQRRRVPIPVIPENRGPSVHRQPGQWRYWRDCLGHHCVSVQKPKRMHLHQVCWLTCVCHLLRRGLTSGTVSGLLGANGVALVLAEFPPLLKIHPGYPILTRPSLIFTWRGTNELTLACACIYLPHPRTSSGR